MKKILLCAALTLGSAVLHPAFAETALAGAAQTVVAEAQPIEVQAQIIGLDRAARTLTLLGPHGNELLVAISPQVDNYDQLRIGDYVNVLYKNALLVAAQKVTGERQGLRERVETNAMVPDGSGYDAARQIEVLATVEHVNRSTRKVTLRGASQTAVIDAGPNVDLAALHAGDTIHAVFVSAYAVRVTRGPGDGAAN